MVQVLPEVHLFECESNPATRVGQVPQRERGGVHPEHFAQGEQTLCCGRRRGAIGAHLAVEKGG